MKSTYYIFLITLIIQSGILQAQGNVEVNGVLKVKEIDTIDHSEFILVQKMDGTFATALPHEIFSPNAAIDMPYHSGWEDYGANFQNCSYHLHADRVYLSGLARKSSGAILNGDTIATLPLGCRPLKRTMGFGKQNQNPVRINIEPDGVIWVVSGAGGNDYIELTGISYYKIPFEIGDFANGGIVFYIANPPVDLNGDGINDKGLVASTVDGPTRIWGCNGTDLPGSSGLEIGAGYQNTIDIISSCQEENTAAYFCHNLVLNGYDDWFLPSLLELIKMNQTIGFDASGDNYNIGNFSEGEYYSSSELDYIVIYYTVMYPQIFENAGIKTPLRLIRPIRVF